MRDEALRRPRTAVRPRVDGHVRLNVGSGDGSRGGSLRGKSLLRGARAQDDARQRNSDAGCARERRSRLSLRRPRRPRASLRSKAHAMIRKATPEVLAWIESRPPKVRAVIEKLGVSCVRGADGRGHYSITAFTEAEDTGEVTLKV